MKGLSTSWVLLYAMSSFLFVQTYAQSFNDPELFNNFPNAVGDMEVIDFDLDGDIDLVAQGMTDQTVGWFENDGAGNFSNYQIIETTTFVGLALAVADYDNDGDLDVVTASKCCSQIYLLRNDGAMNFGSPQPIHNDSPLHDVKNIDIEMDGDMDLVLTFRSKLKVLKNDGTGNFSMAYNGSGLGLNMQESVLIDANNDGLIDLAICDYELDRIGWFENLGGTFSTTYTLITNAVEAPEGLKKADLDGDGDEDLITASNTDDEISWLENNGSGFSAPSVIINASIDARTFHVADVDSDGKVDIINISEGDSDNVNWFRNQGGIVFSSPNVIGSNKHAWMIESGDFDNNGSLDIVTSDMTDFSQSISASYTSTTNAINLYSSTAPGNFGFPTTLAAGAGGGVNSIADIDVDSDGDLDLVAYSNFVMTWNENLGGGNISSGKLLFDGGVAAVTHADLDGDGQNEIVFAADNNLIIGNYNVGTGFTYSIINTTSKPYKDVLINDIDNDGDLDLLAGKESLGSGQINWFENDGAGNFSGAKSLGPNLLFSSETPTKFQLIDMNNDGLLDLIGHSTYRVFVYERTGPGVSFAPRIEAGFYNFMHEIKVADFNNDGFQDILIGSRYNSFGNDIELIYNNGSFSFSAPLAVQSNLEQIRGIEVMDINNDGHLDVLSAGYLGFPSTGEGFFHRHMNDGTGNFGSQIPIDEDIRYPNDMLIADLESDGDLDLIFSTAKAQSGWFENPTITAGCSSPVTGLSGSFTPGSPTDQLQFNWNAIPEATKYLVEISKIDPLPVISKRFLTSSSNLTINRDVPPGTLLEWTVRAACPSDTTEVSVTSSLAIPALRSKAKEVLAFPNPAFESLNFRHVEPFDLQIWNTAGQLMLSETGVGPQHSLDLSNWPDGIYFYQLIGQNNQIQEGQISKQ